MPLGSIYYIFLSESFVLRSSVDLAHGLDTHKTLYNTVRYKTVLDTTRFKDGSQKCKDYIEKMTINGHFFYIIYIFLFGYNTVVHSCITNKVYAFDPNNIVIKRLWCISVL